ncbi:unnamed protein product, partial [Mesorhabditis belari]|uniref:Uncharacterized protein n=1 Tax=Mesorhabditis belari TaxID=2138241 RepID=A0AAF3J7V2_9BILA
MLTLLFLFVDFLLHFVNGDGMCQTCSIFTFVDNSLQCLNPSVCYAEYCYYYITSDRRSLFLAGCVDALDSAFFFYREDPRTVCRTEHHIGLCICRADDGACRVDKNETLYAAELRGSIPLSNSMKKPNFECNFQTTTGVRMEYVRTRVLQMHITDFPTSFTQTKDTL